MATGTFYLRPSADISLGHPVVPDTLGAGYLAINEEVSDGTSTYIGFADPPGVAVSYTSKFAMSIAEQPKITRIISAQIGGYGYTNATDDDGNSNTIITIYVAGTLITTIRDEAYVASDGRRRRLYQDGNNIKDASLDVDNSQWHKLPDIYDYTNLITALNNALASGNFPAVTVEITNSTDNEDTGTKNGATNSYVGQIYLELECEYTAGLNIHHKVNGTWVQAQSAYQKQNGAWVEITEDECKSILQSSFCTK